MAANSENQSDIIPRGEDITLPNIDAERLRNAQSLDTKRRPDLGQGSEETGEIVLMEYAGTDAETSQRGQCDNSSTEADSHIRVTTRRNEDETQIDSCSTGSDAADLAQIQAVSVKYAMEQGYPELNFRFTTLKTWFLLVTVALWLSVIGIVVALINIQLSSQGILHIRNAGNYYSIRYAPALIGTITTIWWRSIIQSYRRILPYFIMANRRMLERDRVEVAAEMNVDMDPEIFDFSEVKRLIKGRHWTALAVIPLGFGIPKFLIAIKSALIQITEDQTGWGITVDPRIGHVIISLYLALCGASLAILVQLWGKQTGLKWSPCSLASQLALVHSSNVFQAFEGMEFCTKPMAARRTRIWSRRFGYLRIGYWKETRVANNANSETIFHGIRFISADEMHVQEDNVQMNRSHHRNERIRVYPTRPYILRQNLYPESEGPVAHLTNGEDKFPNWLWCKPLAFHRYPWSGRGSEFLFWSAANNYYLSDIYIASMMLLTLSCLVALATVLATGVILRPISYANTFAFGNQTTRNIILNTLPAFVFNIANLVFLTSDTYHRILQPIRGMDKPATAQESLLVDYLSPNPLSVITTAVSNGHYRIAWGSFLAMVCSTGPIIAGGMFTVEPASNTFRAATSSAYIVLGLLCVYVIAILIARPDAKYAAGRGLWNIIDTLSFCYDSPIREYPEFSVQGKSDEEIHLKSQVIAARRQYQFGYYLGLSGRRRLGFAEARVEPPSGNAPTSSTGLEAPISPGVDRVKSRYGFLRFNVSWFRPPQVLRSDQPSDIEMVMGDSNSAIEDSDGGGA